MKAVWKWCRHQESNPGPTDYKSVYKSRIFNRLQPSDLHKSAGYEPEVSKSCAFDLRGLWKAFLVLIWLASAWMIAGMAHAQSVYWNPANSVGSGHEALIQHAAWSASQRTGMVVTYAGQTTAAECVANAITYRTASAAEWSLAMDAIVATPAERAGYHGFTFTCPYGGYTLLLSPHWSVDRSTVTHELVCHGLRGYGHLSFSSGALCLSSPPVDALVTTVDADYILASPDWPTPNTPSFCHNELANDSDLQIPQINGKRVRLNYNGIVSGAHQWTVAENVAQPNTKGCANNWTNQDGTVTLNDVRGRTQSFSSATFQPMGGGVWRLVEVVQ